MSGVADADSFLLDVLETAVCGAAKQLNELLKTDKDTDGILGVKTCWRMFGLLKSQYKARVRAEVQH